MIRGLAEKNKNCKVLHFSYFQQWGMTKVYKNSRKCHFGPILGTFCVFLG